MRLNKFIVFSAVLFCLMQLSAQPRIAREVHIGIVGGANMSSYSYAPKVSQDMAQGYTFGIAARYIEEKIFGLQAEFHMTRRGEKDRFDEYPELSFQRDFTYLELPVLAHVYFDLGTKSEINFDLGPKFGYYLSDKSTAQLEGENWESLLSHTYHRYQHHDMPVSNKFDYGLQAGLGYEFKINNGMSLMLQGRYYYGLGNMFPDSKSDVFETSSNQQIQVVAAIWFRSQIAKYKIKRKIRQYSKSHK